MSTDLVAFHNRQALTSIEKGILDETFVHLKKAKLATTK